MKKEYVVELSKEEADELMDEHWVGELVRCKDCMYWEEHHKLVRPEGGSYIAPKCNRLMKKTFSNWFCADGERR